MHSIKSQGSISIFLCLCFTLILSLVLCTTELTHISTVKTYCDGLSYMTIESEFGYFSIPLAENYGLFGIPMSESTALTNMESLVNKNISYSKDYYPGNANLYNLSSFEIRPENILYLSDNQGFIFLHQVTGYMKYANITSDFDYIFNTQTCQKYSKKYVDISSIDSDKNEVDESFCLSEFENDTCNTNDYKEKEAIKKRDSIFKKIKNLMDHPSLTVYLSDRSNLSSLALTTTDLPSHSLNQPQNLDTSDSDKILYLMYLSDKFTSYVDDIKENQPVHYQLEYILNGKACDDDNLLQAIQDIQTLRTGLNLAYLYTDAEKRAVARSISHAAVGLLQIPLLVEFTQLAILSAWAYAEAVLDIRTLLKGKNIPLYKSKSTWTLDFDDLLVLDQDIDAISTEKGISYEQYLMFLLFTNFDSQTIYRTMDLIEADIQQNYDSDFKISKCITQISATFQYNYHPLFFLPDFIYNKTTLFTYITRQNYSY